MRVTVDCESKEEFDEVVEQLIDEGINYQTRILERKTVWISGDDWPDKEHPEQFAYEYAIFFWYNGKLV